MLTKEGYFFNVTFLCPQNVNDSQDRKTPQRCIKLAKKRVKIKNSAIPNSIYFHWANKLPMKTETLPSTIHDTHFSFTNSLNFVSFLHSIKFIIYFSISSPRGATSTRNTILFEKCMMSLQSLFSHLSHALQSV